MYGETRLIPVYKVYYNISILYCSTILGHSLHITTPLIPLTSTKLYTIYMTYTCSIVGFMSCQRPYTSILLGLRHLGGRHRGCARGCRHELAPSRAIATSDFMPTAGKGPPIKDISAFLGPERVTPTSKHLN